MIDLLFVGDGERDHVTVPHLVEGLLGVSVRMTFAPWARLHRQGAGTGYSRKLKFAALQAKDASALGIVLTVDVDKDPQRRKLKELKRGREEYHQSHPPFPIVLGEADPHGEAWLLDDRVAVSQVLGIKADDVPNVQRVKPKEALEHLRRDGARADDRIVDVLKDIAQRVVSARCDHAKKTGFHALAEEVREQLAQVASQCAEDCRCGDTCGRIDKS